jgi:hypothetical protein
MLNDEEPPADDELRKKPSSTPLQLGLAAVVAVGVFVVISKSMRPVGGLGSLVGQFFGLAGAVFTWVALSVPILLLQKRRRPRNYPYRRHM